MELYCDTIVGFEPSEQASVVARRISNAVHGTVVVAILRISPGGA